MKENIKQLLIYLDSGCTRRNSIDPQAQFDLWLDMFGGHTMDELKAAAKSWMSKSKFFPSVHEFRGELPQRKFAGPDPAGLTRLLEIMERKFYDDGKLEPEEKWQTLADQYAAIGRDGMAAYVMERYQRLEGVK